MYQSISEVGKGLSDVQLELLLLLVNGFELVTNEGSGFRVWLELDKLPVAYTVWNRTADILLSKYLMLSIEETAYGLFRYKVSAKGEQVLANLQRGKPERIRRALGSIRNKGIEGINYPV